MCSGAKYAIWENEKGFSFQFSRIYKDQNEQWQETRSFFERDLLNLLEAVREAFQWAREQRRARK